MAKSGYNWILYSLQNGNTMTEMATYDGTIRVGWSRYLMLNITRGNVLGKGSATVGHFSLPGSLQAASGN